MIKKSDFHTSPLWSFEMFMIQTVALIFNFKNHTYFNKEVSFTKSNIN